MYGPGNMLWLRGRRPEGYNGNEKGPTGLWDVELINLALEVSETKFVFEGINNVRYLLAYQALSNGSIEF